MKKVRKKLELEKNRSNSGLEKSWLQTKRHRAHQAPSAQAARGRSRRSRATRSSPGAGGAWPRRAARAGRSAARNPGTWVAKKGCRLKLNFELI